MHKKKKEIIFNEYEEPADYPFIRIDDKRKSKIRELVSKIPANAMNTKEDFNNSHPDREFIGLCGEWAFSEYYNIPYKGVGASGDDGTDYEVKHIPSGDIGTIDIKTSPVRDCNLLNPVYMELKSDAYILIEKRGNMFIFVGTASRDELLNAEIIKAGNRGMKVDTIFIDRDELRTVPEPSELTKPK